MVDPRIAHLIDARLLYAHLVRADQSDLHQIRQDFARYLTSNLGRRAETWQDAWNAWTGATPHMAGRITILTRCKSCSGRGFTHKHAARNMARTGHPMGCGECGGIPGKRVRTTIRATHIAPPEQAEQATEQTGENA